MNPHPDSTTRLYWSDLLVTGLFATTATLKALVILGISGAPMMELPNWARDVTTSTAQALVIVAEAGVAIAILWHRTRAFGRLSALALVSLFLVFFTIALASTEAPVSCGCFGGVDVPPIAHFLILIGMGFLAITSIERSRAEWRLRD